MSILDSLKRFIPHTVRCVLKATLNRDVVRSYSQFGEDAYVASYFLGKNWVNGTTNYLKRGGFYVDVGAYSPTECSNTYMFYLRGWRGINVDASPGVMKVFDLVRRRDTNLNFAVGNVNDELIFYTWGTPSVFNTADPGLAEERARDLGRQPKAVHVMCVTLEKLLDKHLPRNTSIDFLSVDVEGLDLEVLESNNWEKYRPELIIAEVYASTIEQVRDSELTVFLSAKGYSCIAWLNPSVIYRDDVVVKTKPSALGSV
jgi:FkbM family methyltransferase